MLGRLPGRLAHLGDEDQVKAEARMRAISHFVLLACMLSSSPLTRGQPPVSGALHVIR